MRILIKSNNETNIRNLLRRAGYHEFYDRKTAKNSFSRRLTRDHYPRFHIYLQKKSGQTFLNLHLDQKKASYKGQTAHSGEYDSDLVDREGERLRSFIKQQQVKTETKTESPKKISFWSKLFGG